MKVGKINRLDVGRVYCPAKKIPTDSNRMLWKRDVFITDGKKSSAPKQGDITPPEPWPPFKPEPKPRPEPCPGPRPKPLPVPSPNPCPECKREEEESH